MASLNRLARQVTRLLEQSGFDECQGDGQQISAPGFMVAIWSDIVSVSSKRPAGSSVDAKALVGQYAEVLQRKLGTQRVQLHVNWECAVAGNHVCVLPR